MSKLLCLVGLHKWGKWMKYRHKGYTYMYDYRRCERDNCNAHETK